jgi:addiction module HigA family antidote
MPRNPKNGSRRDLSRPTTGVLAARRGAGLDGTFREAIVGTKQKLIDDLSIKRPSGPGGRANEIVHGMRRITADTALRMARYFGTTERFWLNLQGRYGVEIERDRFTEALDEIQPFRSA